MAEQASHTSAAKVKPSAALGFLTLFIVALLAIPSKLIVGPLGGAGTPAEIIGLGLGAWWVMMRLVWRPTHRLRQPVSIAALVFAAAVFASYIAAASRVIAPAEQRAADMGLLSVLAWLGILFVASDGPADRKELDILLRRLCIGGAAIATLGILQFITKQSYTNYLHLPGLKVNADFTSVSSRNGLARPAGTALHPIEFGAVLTTILPISLHYALTDKRRNLIARWYPVLAIAVAVPVSISRSAIVSAVVVLCFLLPTWSRSVRRWATAALVVLTVFLYGASPGLIKTLTDLFSGISNDPSAQSRTGSYGLAWDFISRAPVFGRGFPTFLSSYRILDNQYLGILIYMGFVGLIALLAFLLTGMITALRVRLSSTDETVRSLAQALAASVAAAIWSFAVFDAFSFPMAASLLFMVLGCVGALRRVTSIPSDQPTAGAVAVPPVRDAVSAP